MSRPNIAFLELKYGNIYGGYPNFYAVSEASLLVYEPSSQRIFLESWQNNADVDIVSVFSHTDRLGHTIGRGREVVNLRTRRIREYKEDFRLDDRYLQRAFFNLRPTRRPLNSFFLKNFRKYGIRDLITFDGRRDIFLLEKAQIRFDSMNIIDLQKELNQETDYLFSLNKLSVIIGFDADTHHLRSNNLNYWLHPIALRQVRPKTAAFDAARLLMVHNEFREHYDDFMMKAALLLNKIQVKKEKDEEVKKTNEEE